MSEQTRDTAVSHSVGVARYLCVSTGRYALHGRIPTPSAFTASDDLMIMFRFDRRRRGPSCTKIVLMAANPQWIRCCQKWQHRLVPLSVLTTAAIAAGFCVAPRSERLCETTHSGAWPLKVRDGGPIRLDEVGPTFYGVGSRSTVKRVRSLLLRMREKSAAAIPVRACAARTLSCFRSSMRRISAAI